MGITPGPNYFIAPIASTQGSPSKSRSKMASCIGKRRPIGDAPASRLRTLSRPTDEHDWTVAHEEHEEAPPEPPAEE